MVGFTRPLEKDGKHYPSRFAVGGSIGDWGRRIDLWELDDHRRAQVVTGRLESNFYARCPPEKRPAHLRLSTDNDKNTTDATDAIDDSTGNGNDEKGLEMLEGGEASPVPENANTSDHAGRPARKAEGKGKKTSQYDSSLPLAIQRTFFVHFWLSGVLYAIGGMSIPHSTHHET